MYAESGLSYVSSHSCIAIDAIFLLRSDLKIDSSTSIQPIGLMPGTSRTASLYHLSDIPVCRHFLLEGISTMKTSLDLKKRAIEIEVQRGAGSDYSAAILQVVPEINNSCADRRQKII